MKNFIKLIATIALTIITATANAQDTIQATVTLPDTTGACLNNLYSIKFKGEGQQRIFIQAYILVGGQPINYYTCTSPLSAPPVFIQYSSANTTISNQQIDTINGIWSGSFNETDTVIINYHVYIDCSVIPDTLINPNINLVQLFSDSANVIYDINGSGADSLITGNLKTPYIADKSPSYFFGSYLNIVDLTFLYRNTGTANAHIKFRFFPDSSDYCQQLPSVDLMFAQGNGNPYFPLTAGALTSATIDVGDTLLIRQRVQDTLCIQCDTACFNATCTKKAVFEWQCNNPPADNGIFCNECINVYESEYQVLNGDTPFFKLERILPIDLATDTADYDPSCMNDTTNMLHWEYRITNIGKGALDSVFIQLGGLDVYPFLTLVPVSSFSYDTICNGCIVTDTIVQRSQALCSSFIPNALAYAKITVKNFHENDTIVVRFQTLRCSQDTSVLLNADKTYNHFTLPITAKSVCGNNSSRLGYPLYATVSGISSHYQNGGPDVDQNLVFMPTVTDLSIAPGFTFGDSATFEVELNGIFGAGSFDYQLIGKGAGAWTPRGYIRAVVHCEQNLRIENPATGAKLKILDAVTDSFVYSYPVYYYTLVNDTLCEPGDYFYYFNLSDSAMLNFFEQGFFEFTLQACCGGDIAVTPYDVSFYMMANPDSCFTLSFTDTTHTTPPGCTGFGCAWLPLSSRGGHIYTHCPGCLHPGLIVDDYEIKRTSFGLQDSDDDDRADTGFVQITDTSAWFATKQQYLKPSFSSFGDIVEDFLTAHFQEGDVSLGGYTYQQMLDVNVQLPFLQLSRQIPAALDTMKLYPLEFTLYIDTPDFVNPNCIDCNPFSVNPLLYRTQQILHINGIDSNYLDTTVSANRYLFTFQSKDSSGILVGNLHDTAYITHIDTLSPFTGFFEMQQYRLKVKYRECGNFVLGQLATYDLDNVSKRSEILNQMWLSGAPHPHNAYSLFDQAPNTVAQLDSLNWTLDPLDTLNTLINDSFASSYLFYCETFGGIHYFFSQDARNESTIGSFSGCNKIIEVNAASRIAGNVIDIYPYEYRPPSLWAQQYQVTVPYGYKIIQSRVRNLFRVNNANRSSNWHTFIPPATTGTFILMDSILPNPSCLPQSVNFSASTGFPLNTSDTLQYVGSAYTQRKIQFILAPDSCNTDTVITPSVNSIIISFDKETYSCIEDATCSLDSALVRSLPQQPAPITIHPNVQVSAAPLNITVNTHHVCLQVFISNPSVTWQPGNIASTGAANVYIAVPNSLTVPFISNWSFNMTSVTPDTIYYPLGNELFTLDNDFPVNDIIIGDLCFDYNACLGDTSFQFHVGWNCNGYPSVPFSSDSVCNDTIITVELHDADYNIITEGKVHPAYYNRCEPFNISACYRSQQDGSIYPDSISLNYLPPGLSVLNAMIYNCTDSTIMDTLNQINPLTWEITGNNMSEIGYPDSAISNNNDGCICALISLMPGCNYAGDSLPTVILHSVSFCLDTLQTPADYQPPFIMLDSNACNNCFTLTKQASTGTAIVGIDTIDFNITICANNALSDTIPFLENLPNNFIPVTSIPATVILPDSGCITVTVSGYYTSSGNCSDTGNVNTASIIASNGDTISDNDCVHVYESCAAVSDTIIPDSSFASSYGSGFAPPLDTIYIDGRFYINIDFSFNNCIVYTAAGAQIIVLPGNTLTVDSATDISGCTNMWRGIVLEGENFYYERNNSKVRDANIGLYVNNTCRFFVENSDITECIIGIYTPPDTAYHSTLYGEVTGSRFGFWNNGALKPDYQNQPYHGITPKAGIELNNVTGITIGDNAANPNQFNRMNAGIVGIGSVLRLTNNEYTLLQDDTAYAKPYGGTGVVSESDASNTPADITVLPLAGGGATVNSCKRGVYTIYSTAKVIGLEMQSVETGVFATKCSDHKTTLVTGCTIYATRRGIDFFLNPGTGGMTASYNYVYVTGKKTIGISMQEGGAGVNAPYNTYCNYVDNVDGGVGIYANYLTRPVISKNVVTFSNPGTFTGIIGISLNASTNANIVYNDVRSNTVAALDTNKWAVFVSISDYSNISCNTLDSTGWGFYFDGSCIGTNFRGNKMYEHYEGLHLNKVAVIDTQTHAGNRWMATTYGSGFGAVNRNISPPSNVFLSLFYVHTLPATQYHPLVPSFNSNWFVFTSGTPYSCPSTLPCYDPDFHGDDGSGDLRMMIAEDSTLSSEYIEETKSMAKMQLYEQIKNDSASYAADSLMMQFKAESDSNAIGQLYAVKEKLSMISTFDSLSLILIYQTDSLFNLSNENLRVLDSIAASDTSTDYSMQRDSLINELNDLQQTRKLLIAQHDSTVQVALAYAKILNNAISPSQLPEENEQFMNNVSSLYYLYGRDSIASFYSQILDIAMQCPDAGGKAVYRARPYVELFNDSVEYNDVDICHQAGIYRETIKENKSENKGIKIIPNPANESIELIITGKYEGICKVILQNTVSENVYSKSFDCKLKQTKIKTSNFAPGVYYVQLYINNKPVQFEKLIIIR